MTTPAAKARHATPNMSVTSHKPRPWRARYRDAEGVEHARHFARKVEAQRWLDGVTAAVVTGAYVDPRAGRRTVREYGEEWRSSQVHRATTAAHVETMLRRHVYPALGARQLAAVRPSEVQVLIKRLSVELAPATVGVVHRILAGVFKAAVRDRLIASSPCEGTRLPRLVRARVEPLTLEAVEALARTMPPRLRALVTLAAGTGLRQGEAFGLTVDRVSFLRRTLTVDRQLVLLPGREPYLAPPNTTASVRTVPLPSVVVDSLAAHLAEYPPPGRGVRVHQRCRATAATHQVQRPGVAAGRGRRRITGRHSFPRSSTLLRLVADPARGVGQGRPVPARSRQRGRDPGHVLPPVARLR